MSVINMNRSKLSSNGVDGKTEVFQDEKRTILFVNSEIYPDRHVPLNLYKYKKDGDTVFYRLYKDIWVVDVGDGFSVAYSTHVWYEISVKEHCKQALINMIDSFNAAQEFLHS
jgi:hypothetical protein